MSSFMQITAGRPFAGDFVVVRPLAEGGMGAIFEVEQRSTHKRRALKIIRPGLLGDPRNRERFVQEATVSSSIDSEHVVEIIAAGVDADTGLPWLAMELLDGGDLARLVKQRGPLAPGVLLEITRQLGHGLAGAHDAGVVHRDLKPENIHVGRSRRAGAPFTVKILDFGIAKVLREAAASTATTAMGSPLWMAPEQINAAQISPRTDVWALGLIAYWALTGRSYWPLSEAPGVSVQALLAAILFDGLAPASTRAAEQGVGERIPSGFDPWFARCVVRESEARYVDAREALGELERVLDATARAGETRRGRAAIVDTLAAHSRANAAVTDAPSDFATSPTENVSKDLLCKSGDTERDASTLPSAASRSARLSDADTMAVERLTTAPGETARVALARTLTPSAGDSGGPSRAAASIEFVSAHARTDLSVSSSLVASPPRARRIALAAVAIALPIAGAVVGAWWVTQRAEPERVELARALEPTVSDRDETVDSRLADAGVSSRSRGDATTVEAPAREPASTDALPAEDAVVNAPRIRTPARDEPEPEPAEPPKSQNKKKPKIATKTETKTETKTKPKRDPTKLRPLGKVPSRLMAYALAEQDAEKSDMQAAKLERADPGRAAAARASAKAIRAAIDQGLDKKEELAQAMMEDEPTEATVLLENVKQARAWLKRRRAGR